VAGAGDQDRAIGSRSGQQRLGHLRVAGALHDDHRVDEIVRSMPAVGVADLFGEGDPHVRGERLREAVTPDERGVQRPHALPAHGSRPLGIEIRDHDRQVGLERRPGDRLVDRPCGPARRLPVHGLADAGGVPRPRREMTGERARLRWREHLEGDRRTAPRGRERAEQPCLERVVIRVVVLLPEQHVPRLHDPRDRRRLGHEPPGRHVPDPADEPMLTPDGGLPGDIGDARAAGREEDQEGAQRP